MSLNSLNALTPFDYLIAFILLLFIVRGIWMGFTAQIATFLAFIGSYWLAGQYSGELLPYVQQITESPRDLFFIGFAMSLLVSALIFTLISQLLRKIMKLKSIGWLDRFFLGTVFGFSKGVLAAVFFYMILSSYFSPSFHFFQDSVTVPYLDKGAVTARMFIMDAKIRENLTPKEPAADEMEQTEELEAEPKSEPEYEYETGEQEMLPLEQDAFSEFPEDAAMEHDSEEYNEHPENSTEILTH